MTFKDLGLIEPIMRALASKGYETPTPIQEQAIPILLKGRDLLGCAQTGTGKTAAFSIPIIQFLANRNSNPQAPRKIRALIVTPTRELALQIDENIAAYARYTDLKHTVIFGGVKQGKQTDRLGKGIDILTATPGRLLDLIGQRFISLSDLDFFVLDEADQMLDMGFIHDVRKLIAMLPQQRQSLFFSATMPPVIIELAGKILGDHDTITIRPEQPTADRIDQAIYFVSKDDKNALLTHLLQEKQAASALVFSRTKHGADKIVKKLAQSGIRGAAIHGNKSQPAREKALHEFKTGKIKVLIATDIAARGIDISALELVINYDLPNVAETYVHRIGRTGRAGAGGEAISFCMLEERPYLKDIQKLIKQNIPVATNNPYPEEGEAVVYDPNANASARNQPSSPRTSNRSTSNGSTSNGSTSNGSTSTAARRPSNNNRRKRRPTSQKTN